MMRRSLLPTTMLLVLCAGFGRPLAAQTLRQVWERSFLRGDQAGRALARGADGGFLIGGYGQERIEGTPDLYRARANPEGEFLSERYVDLDLVDQVTSVAALADGGFVVAGATKGGEICSITCPHQPEKSDVLLARIDEGGELAWTQTFDGQAQDVDIAWSVIQSRTGDIVAAGSTRGPGRLDDLLLLRVDEDGGLMWQRGFGGPG